MRNDELKNELIDDVYNRASNSAYGHILLSSIFLIISKNYIASNMLFLYLCLICVTFSIIRMIACKNYFKNKSTYSAFIIESSTLMTGLMWGILFSVVYSKLGLKQTPTLSLFIIVGGIASAGTSSLYGKKALMVPYLAFVLLIPGSIIIYHEIDFHDKMIGLLAFAYFSFLYAQSKISLKNLTGKLELAYYLEAEAKRVESLFNSVPGYFCYFQADGKILASNQGWKDFKSQFSYSENFFQGIELGFTRQIKDFINSKEEKISLEFQFTKIANAPYYICNAQKIINNKGIILFLLDITSLKMIQEEMKLKDAHFQHSARLIELGEMLGSIAHEINNPLTIISGRAQVSKRILKSDVDEKLKLIANMEMIEISTQRISKLVKGMKSLVRNAEADPFTSQSFESHLEIVNFLIASKAELRKVNFDFQIQTNDLIGFCRPTQIEQVLINLLNNAVDAAESTEEKWVKLIITSDTKYLRFEIVDSGIGISDEQLNKIWNPFYTTKEIGKGTGLGLAIAHSIILENNGNIYYDKSNKNTSFVVEIPKISLAA